MKLMVWWAQRLGVGGLACSTAELQAARRSRNGPPEALYRTALPDAARSPAKTLGDVFDQARLSARTSSRRVDLGRNGRTVRNRDGVAITKPFRTRDRAECLANQTGDFVDVDVPVLWIKGMPRIRAISLYGVAAPDLWFQAQAEPTKPVQASLTADQKVDRHAKPSQ